MGLLSADAMSGIQMDNSTTSMFRENISLGRYLQPAHASLASQSEPLSDSDEEENAPPLSFTVQPTGTQEPFKMPSHSFLVPSVPQTPNSQVHPSNNSTWGFSWDKIVNGNTSQDISSFQKVSYRTLWISCIALYDIFCSTCLLIYQPLVTLGIKTTKTLPSALASSLPDPLPLEERIIQEMKTSQTLHLLPVSR